MKCRVLSDDGRTQEKNNKSTLPYPYKPVKVFGFLTKTVILNLVGLAVGSLETPALAVHPQGIP
ncbi:hypothetical protein JCM12296A_25520 [Desulfosarcina cetonica]